MTITYADVINAALEVLTLGYPAMPSGSGPKGKFPFVKWKEFQKRLPTKAELKHWQNSIQLCLWGVMANSACFDHEKISGMF